MRKQCAYVLSEPVALTQFAVWLADVSWGNFECQIVFSSASRANAKSEKRLYGTWTLVVRIFIFSRWRNALFNLTFCNEHNWRWSIAISLRANLFAGSRYILRSVFGPFERFVFPLPFALLLEHMCMHMSGRVERMEQKNFYWIQLEWEIAVKATDEHSAMLICIYIFVFQFIHSFFTRTLSFDGLAVASAASVAKLIKNNCIFFCEALRFGHHTVLVFRLVIILFSDFPLEWIRGERASKCDIFSFALLLARRHRLLVSNARRTHSRSRSLWVVDMCVTLLHGLNARMDNNWGGDEWKTTKRSRQKKEITKKKETRDAPDLRARRLFSLTVIT